MSKIRARSGALAAATLVLLPIGSAIAVAQQPAQDSALVRQEIERIRGERRPWTEPSQARGALADEAPRGVGLRAEAMIAYTGGFDLAAGERTSAGFGPMVGFALTAPASARTEFALAARLSQTDFALREFAIADENPDGGTIPGSSRPLTLPQISTFAAELSAGLEQKFGASGTGIRVAALGMRLSARQRPMAAGGGPAWLAGGELGLGIPIAPWARASIVGQHMRRAGGNPALPIDGSMTRVLTGIQFGW